MNQTPTPLRQAFDLVFEAVRERHSELQALCEGGQQDPRYAQRTQELVEAQEALHAMDHIAAVLNLR